LRDLIEPPRSKDIENTIMHKSFMMGVRIQR
jgi:hypothetical protein